MRESFKMMFLKEFMSERRFILLLPITLFLWALTENIETIHFLYTKDKRYRKSFENSFYWVEELIKP